MEWLNYHHLFYFWIVAKEGSIARATQTLRLAQPTISAQIRTLEDHLGEKLFERRGRGLVLTEMGRLIQRYADEIFTLGRELQEVVKGRPTGRPLRLTVGVSDVIPKLVAHHLLEPALSGPAPVHLVCLEDRTDRLLAALAVHELDIVLADEPIAPLSHIRGFNHLLGECGITILGTPELASAHRRRFPKSLDGAPFLLPTVNTTVRRALDQWFESQGVRPRVVAEFEDSALLKTFAQAGHGLFAVPNVIEREIAKQYGVRALGRIDTVRERFYAISVERRLQHPAVVALTEAARSKLFS